MLRFLKERHFSLSLRAHIQFITSVFLLCGVNECLESSNFCFLAFFVVSVVCLVLRGVAHFGILVCLYQFNGTLHNLFAEFRR